MKKENELYLLNSSEGGKLARKRKKARTELQLCLDTLQDFRTLCESSSLTESSKAGPVPASEKTRIELALKIAKTISDVGKNAFLLDSENMIHYDEVSIRVNLMISSVFRHFEIIREKMLQGREQAVEEAKDSFIEEFKQIWQPSATRKV